MLTEVLSAIGDKADTEGLNCLSNEELLAAFTEVNLKDMKEPIILSMDVKSMYPNLNIEKVAEITATEFLESGLKVELDKNELSLYLAIIYQGKKREEIVALGLDEVIPKRRCPRARAVMITTRDGQAESDDAEVCGLMRICGSVAEDKICMRHSRQKKQGQK